MTLEYELSDGSSWTVPPILAAKLAESGDVVRATPAHVVKLIEKACVDAEKPRPLSLEDLSALVRVGYCEMGLEEELAIYKTVLQLFALEVVRESGVTNMFMPQRVHGLVKALEKAFPDVFCTQTTFTDVLKFLEETFERSGNWGITVMPEDGDPGDPLASWIEGGAEAAGGHAEYLSKTFPYNY